MKLVIATKNPGKLKEFKAILGGEREVLGMCDAGVDVEVIEDGLTFEQNALKKATEIMRLCGEVTIADDSGLCVDALSGAPGIYSARYADDLGFFHDDHQNNLKLLRNMEGVTDRSAQFVCALAAAFPDGRTHVVTAHFHGEIAHTMSGSGGFGYDVLFYLPEYGMTAAEIPADLKNKISHRAQAIAQMRDFLLPTP